jgi:hypothetical protein
VTPPHTYNGGIKWDGDHKWAETSATTETVVATLTAAWTSETAANTSQTWSGG